MAETSLRAYVREIDDLIEHEQLDEAIAHARHILQTYPRHLDTYRLLGKAYLEAKRYGDSADILQRVLSAVPDDFVAHIGMSIVREDEGNLDAAIWHMERAFETNPSNAAVQGELRRLIGRRDGLEPHKVRLTRGALARMYAHGELYPQAIAELRAALTEDPDRPDLQVLLADMYWRTNQRAEAAEVASAVLGTLPNCRDANRILAAALHAQGRTEEALTYHRRVAALDPYSALVETISEDASSVDANAVRIEKLVWQPGQPVGRDTGPADWATGAGGTSARPAAPRPSWLDSLGAETAARAAAAAAVAARVKEESSEPAPASAAVPTQRSEAVPPKPAGQPIPEWMEAAGWAPGTGEVTEGPVSFSDDELRSLEAGMLPPDAAPEPEGGLARADIPDWLKDVAPPEASEATEAVPQASAEGPRPEGMGLDEPRLPPGWSAPAADADQEDDWLKAAAEDAPAVPTWMEEQAPGATATIVTWLGDRSRQEAPPPARPEAPLPPPAAEPEPAELPSWLADQAPLPDLEAQGTDGEAVPGAPAWLSGVAEAAAMGSSLGPEDVPWEQEAPEEPIQTGMYPEAETPAQPADLPEWLQTIAGVDVGARARSQGDAGPEWLQPEPPREAKPAAPPPDAGSESFGWLRELAESEPPTPSAPPAETPSPSWMAEPAPGARAALGRSAGPEWLRGIAEPEPSSGDETTSMDWLRGIAEAPAGETAAPTEAPPPMEAEPAAQQAVEWMNLVGGGTPGGDSTSTGEWLRLLKEDGVPPIEDQGGPPAAAVAAAAAAPAGEMDDAQVFDWLEALAAKQGIPAPESIQPEGSTTPSVALPAAPPSRAEPPKPIPEEPAAGLAWLEQLAAEQSPASVAAPEPPPTVAVVAAAPAPAPEPTTFVVAAMAAAGPPAETRPAETTVPATPAAAPSQPTPEVPDWLKQLVAETPVAEAAPAVPTTPTAETWPSLPEWMVTPQPAEDEPTVPPLPPVAAAPVISEPAPAVPIDELAESWVPPWEQLAEEPEAPAISVGPTDETVVHRPTPKPAAVEPTEEREPELAEAAPVRYKEPTTDVLQEVPDWLRTPAPRRIEIPELTPEPEVAPEPASGELDVPDWLVAPAPVVAAVEPRAQTVAAPVGAAATTAEPEALPAPEMPVAAAPPALAPERAAPVAVAPPAPTPVAPPPIEVAPVVAAEPTAQRRAQPVPPVLPPAASARKAPGRAPKAKAATPGLEDRLVEARQALAVGDYRRAAAEYGAVIKRKYQLDEVTSELEVALNRNPKAAPLWQALGDAYMKDDRLPDAITAYERGMAAA